MIICLVVEWSVIQKASEYQTRLCPLFKSQFEYWSGIQLAFEYQTAIQIADIWIPTTIDLLFRFLSFFKCPIFRFPQHLDQNRWKCLPKLKDSRSTTRDNGLRSWQKTESGDPILVRVVDGPDQLLWPQVPLLDARVSGGREEEISGHGQTLDAVVMWRVKIDCGGHDAPLAVCDVEDFDVVIFGTGYDVVPFVVNVRLAGGQAHDCSL